VGLAPATVCLTFLGRTYVEGRVRSSLKTCLQDSCASFG
jgi:hypothetical protein